MSYVHKMAFCNLQRRLHPLFISFLNKKFDQFFLRLYATLGRTENVRERCTSFLMIS